MIPVGDANSLAFKLSNMGVDECIMKNFDIGKDGEELFKDKFCMAVSGSGEEGSGEQHAKILEAHSSSLLSLLFFYNVDKKGIAIKCNDKVIHFNKSYFEFKNKVIGYPSNMDVVLLSEEDNAILFLESKFTEYLSISTKSKAISSSYLNEKYRSKAIYYGLKDKYNVKIIEDKSRNEFILQSDTKTYFDGIKQLISHYVGICNFIDHEYYGNEENDVRKFFEEKNPKVYFGTILYQFEDNEFKSILNEYNIRYKNLIEVFRKQSSNIEFLNEIIKYQDIDSSHLNDTIKKYYKL